MHRNMTAMLRALILFIQTLALYKSFTYLLTYLLIRPPVYGSNGRTYKMLVMFLSFFFHRQISELPRPIAAKLCHMIRTGVYFIN